MKIVVVHNRYRSSSPSGEDRVVDLEHEALVAAGHEVLRFERRSDDIAGLSLVRKALVPPGMLWSPGPARELEGVLKAYRPDLVHIHNLFPLLSPSLLLACRRSRVPTVVTFHNFTLVCPAGTLFRDGSVCRACVGRRFPIPALAHGCYQNSAVTTVPRALSIATHRKLWRTVPSAYIFISEAQRLELEPAGLPFYRSFVKPNLVPPVRPAHRSEELIVFVGRLTEEKGLRVLMDAWNRHTAGRPNPKLRLAIAGTGPLEPEIRSWATQHGSVDVLGLLDRSACTELMTRAAAIVAPSEWPEPFGMVVAEAMASAVPPIATAHAAFKEMITDGYNGLLYPPGDADALSRILGSVENDPRHLTWLGPAAYDTYLKRFAPRQNVSELERIYRYAISHPRGEEPDEPEETGIPGAPEVPDGQ